MNGNVTLLIAIIFLVIFAYYKRDMLIRLFTLQASAPSQALSEELTKTADAIIKRLENEISHLEYLLLEAEAKSAELEKKLTAAEHMIKTMHLAPAGQEPDTARYETDTLPAAEQTEPVMMAKDTFQADKRSVVVTMAEQGYTITEIAKSTGMGKGEIMLLLHLHKK